MRGKGLDGIDTDAALGITPAYAGKSALMGNALMLNGDHPRVCGEKCSSLICGI